MKTIIISLICYIKHLVLWFMPQKNVQMYVFGCAV